MTHEEAIAKLEQDIRLRGMSPHTVKEYKSKAKHFLGHFNKPISELSEKDFNYKSDIQTIDSYIKAAKERDLIIAEVGIWNNLLKKTREN